MFVMSVASPVTEVEEPSSSLGRSVALVLAPSIVSCAVISSV
jgi:hypothetical protein